MYTAKRKLHNFLESITGPPSVEAYPRNEDAILVSAQQNRSERTKRQKVFARSTARPDLRSDPRNDFGKVSRPGTAVEQRPAHGFAPWDRAQFLRRLKTFRHVDKWSAKPRLINEVQWAKRGWTCVGPERVKCAGVCGKELVTRLSDAPKSDADHEVSSDGTQVTLWQEDAYSASEDALVARYQVLIVEAHEESCLWRRRGCDDNIYHLPLAVQSVCVPALTDRYKGLQQLSDDIPLALQTPEITSEVLIRVMSFTGRALSDSNELHRNSFLLALFGWEAESDHVTGLISCQACFRRLGLWLFKVNPTAPDTDSEATVGKLDLKSEHRDYCPWINAASQSGSVKGDGAPLAGWEVLLQTLANASVPLPGVSDEREGSPAQPSHSRPLVNNSHVASSPDQQSSRATKDEDRWSRLRKMKRLFDTKSVKKT